VSEAFRIQLRKNRGAVFELGGGIRAQVSKGRRTVP
jgi:hypothetical protein